MAYCTQCGTALQDTFKFCPGCGAATNSSALQETEPRPQTPPTEEEFTSNMLLGGNVITPDRLILGTTSVIYRKRNKYLYWGRRKQHTLPPDIIGRDRTAFDRCRYHHLWFGQ